MFNQFKNKLNQLNHKAGEKESKTSTGWTLEELKGANSGKFSEPTQQSAPNYTGWASKDRPGLCLSRSPLPNEHGLDSPLRSPA